MADERLSKAATDRIASGMPLFGSYHRDCLSRMRFAIADLRAALDEMTPLEAKAFALDDLLGPYNALTALMDDALKRGNL